MTFIYGLAELTAGSVVEKARGHPSKGLSTQPAVKGAGGHPFHVGRRWLLVLL